MKNLLSALLIIPAFAFAAPLDKPVAIAVRTAAETDPALKPLWEAVALADLQIIEARTARDAAVKDADAKIGGFIRSDAGIVLEGLRKELSATGAKLKQAESDLTVALGKLRSNAVTSANRRSDLFGQAIRGTVTDAEAASESAKLDAAGEALAETCRGFSGRIGELRSAAEALRASIAAQEKRIADARATARADLPQIESALAQAQAAKATALAAFRDAAKAKLLAAHPESADAINAYFGK
jgi:hypothetical protein